VVEVVVHEQQELEDNQVLFILRAGVVYGGPVETVKV
jgi:hypothetical protein